MSVDKNTVRKVARLARIAVPEERLEPLAGELNDMPMRTDPYFGFQVPTAVPGVDSKLLTPRETWADKAEFDTTARSLAAMFNKNFASFEKHVDADVKAAAPGMLKAAQ